MKEIKATITGTPKLKGETLKLQATRPRGAKMRLELTTTEKTRETLKEALKLRTPDQIPADVQTTAGVVTMIQTLGKDLGLPKKLQATLGKITGDNSPKDIKTILRAISEVTPRVVKASEKAANTPEL